VKLENHDPVLSVDVLSSAATLGAAEWSELANGASLYSSYQWVRWCEESPEHVAVHLVCRASNGRALAVLPAFFWNGSGSSPSSWYDPHRVFLASRDPSAERHPGWFPLLLLGSCAGYRGDILFAPRASPDARARAAEKLVSRAREIAAGAGGAVAAMYLPSTATELLAATATFWPRPVPTSAEAVIPVDVGGLDAFLAGLSGKRRRTVLREIRAFDRAGHRVELFSLGEAWPIAGRLLGGLQRKYGEQDADEVMLAYLESQVTFLDEVSTVIVEYDGSTPVGFCLTYQHGTTLYARAAGFSPEAAPFAYFNIVMYQCLELAAARGLRAVNLGTGAYQAKWSRGARLDELWSAVAPPNRLPPDQRAALNGPAGEALEAHAVSSGCCFPGITPGRRVAKGSLRSIPEVAQGGG
jgi:hypothetical protein